MRITGHRFERLGMRFRLVISFGTILLVAMIGTTLSFNYYNQKFIRELLEQNNAQKIRELNYGLNGLYDKITQIFISFNSENIYEMFEKTNGLSNFEKMRKLLAHEQVVKETINANNLQSVIIGNIFYINKERKAYVGNGTMNWQYSLEDAVWYQRFQENGSTKLIYGPVIEDFRPANSAKSEAVYYIREWNVPLSSGMRTDEIPFILFSISMTSIRSIFDEYTEESKGFLVMDETGNYLMGINLNHAQENEIIELIHDNKGELSEGGTYMNTEWFIAGGDMNRMGWQVYSVESTEDTFRDMNRIIRNINLIILLTGACALFLSVVFSSRIMMPITLLNGLISTIEEENDTFIQVKTNDEVGQIGHRFNQMKRKLQKMSADMYLSRVQEKEAQLSALQSQINPHFLYNTLDNIYCIAQIEEVDSIVRLSDNLSKMMRYSIDMNKRIVPVSKEIQHVKAYVEIINIRFDDSICLELAVEEEIMHLGMMKLSLQPLVENAWNHGILKKPGHQGRIRIQIKRNGQELFVTVTDNGIGISRERSEEMNRMLSGIDYGVTESAKGFGIALKNVNNRIKLSDGEDYGITIYPDEAGGCKVFMKLRYRL